MKRVLLAGIMLTQTMASSEVHIDEATVEQLKEAVKDECGSVSFGGFSSWYEPPDSAKVKIEASYSGHKYGSDTSISGNGLVFAAITNTYVSIRRNYGDTTEYLPTLSYIARKLSLNKDGTRLVVSDKTDNTNRGSVHVYEHDGTDGSQWQEIGTLSGDADGDKFGSDVDINAEGDRIVIGAHKKAYVYDFDGTNWIKKGETISFTSGYDDEISAVAISGDGKTVVLGMPNADTGPVIYGSKQNLGKTYVYRLGDDGNWEKKTERYGPNGDYYCGTSVAVNGNGTVVAGGCAYNLNTYGLIHIFRESGGDWVQSKHEKYMDNNGQWGRAVALSEDGQNLVAGAPLWSAGGSKANAGKIYYFRFIDNEWKQMAVKNAESPDYTNAPFYAFFGSSCDVSDDGSIIAVGQPGDDGRKSSARVYELKSKLLKYATANQIISAYGQRSTSECTL